MKKEKSTTQQSGGHGQQEHTIYGAKVKIAEVDGYERLLIDGRPAKYHKTDAGYLLNANMYVEPQKTLLDAVKLYLQREAKSFDHHSQS